MQRRAFLSAAAASTILAQPRSSKPNVLFLLADDMRADTIGALGNKHVRTPTLDALAAKSLVFRNAYCMGGDSAAVCTPSRNMIMSGRSFYRYKGQASPDQPNFPAAMKQLGYETYHHGKRGNTAILIQAKFDTCKYVSEDGPNGVRASAAPGRVIAEDAIAFLKNRSKDKPFFLSLSFETPHDPRIPSPEDADYHNTHPVPVPANYQPQHPFDNGEMTVRDELLAPWPRPRDEVQKHLNDYYAVITGLDRQIGRILKALEDTDEADNTLVIFTSDQGLAIGSHGLMGKQNLYDAGMKVPFLVSGPNVRKGTSDAMIYLMDLLPTVLDYAGGQVPAGLDGRSFAMCLADPRTPARDALFFAYRDVQRGIRDKRYKLLLYPKVARTQLFDLRNDPHERQDLSADSAQRARVAAMTKRLTELQAQFGDTLSLRVDTPQPADWQPPGKEELNRIRKRWNMPPVS